jgi:hypothetical protein
MGQCTTMAFGMVGAACDLKIGATACDAGLYCPGGTGTCTPQLGQGEACSQSDACQSPFVCVTPAGSAMGMCQPRGGAGATCGQETDCAEGFACASFKCATITWAGPGQPCDNGTKRCAAGLCPVAIEGPTASCPAIVNDGAACNPADETKTCDSQANCVVAADAGVSAMGECVLGPVMCK